jgi:glycosyltransferase involved in cell wall biosynthesis
MYKCATQQTLNSSTGLWSIILNDPKSIFNSQRNVRANQPKHQTPHPKPISLTFAARMRELSLVIPVMNEEDNIKPLLEAVRDALRDFDFEVILVDDGSTDATRKRIVEYADDRTVLVELRKNYGQSTAMTAGIDHANGKYVALLDGDLQNDPTDIPFMLELLKREDWDVVAGNRKNRKDGMVLRKIPSKIANAMIRRMTGVYIKDYGCTLKIFKKEIAEDLGLYGELHRFIPVLAKLQGARITQVDVKHHPRKFGKSKYGIGRTFRVLSDLVLMVFFRRYMQKPMHLFGTLGFIAFGLGLLINAYLLILKILGQDIWGKPILILGLIFLLGGIQLITIGILAEIAVRTYYESQSKKTYQVRKVYHKEKVQETLEITV